MAFPERPRALITGAGSGLGRALAVALAERRARLFLTDIDPEGLSRTAEAAAAAGAEVMTAPHDVGDAEAWAGLPERLEPWGGLDILVNNAGVAVSGPMGAVSLDNWKWQLDVNLWSVVYGCHTFVPMFRSQGSGWILNVASTAGLVSLPELGPYNVTKSAVVALSRTLRAELAGTGVKVSALCPTFFQSRIHERARTAESQVELTRVLIEGARWTADDVAQVALRNLERGKLHILPQLDAKLAWLLQRLWPSGFQWVLTQLHGSALLEDWAKRRSKALPAPGETT